MSVRDLAGQHYDERRRLIRALTAQGRESWHQLDRSDLDGSWSTESLRMMVLLSATQTVAAGRADDYTDRVVNELGLDIEPAGRVVPAALSGVASDGRDLRRLLLSPLVTTRTALGRGASMERALASGQASLDMILRTQVADAGRVADGIAVAARPTLGWVRQVTPPSCPRCVVLAGKFYRYNQGFQRHPSCDCVHVPAPESLSDDLTTDPRQLFDQGQVTGLSKADAQAIRDGADMNQVINAHRGMYTADGGRKATRALAGRRGIPGMRLRPEQIFRDAVSRDDAVRLLRLHGYLR